MAFSAPPGTIPARGFDWDLVQFPAKQVDSFAELRYGKALQQGKRRFGNVPVYGTNGRCGWHDQPLDVGPGVVLGRKGQGHLGVKWCAVPFWVIDTAYYAVLDADQVDQRWFYFLTKYVGLDHLKAGEKPGLSRDVFYRQLYPFPKLDEQRAIGRLLAVLEDKISLNQRMNRTLEELARALLKSWFVDFDPVVARAAGRRPPGVPASVVNLFPKQFAESAAGAIPKGWRVGIIGDEFTLVMGHSPPGSTYNKVGEGVPFFQGCTDFGFRFPARRVFCTAPTRYANRGDTLVSVRAPVGDTNMAIERCAIGRGVAAVRHASGSRSYTYHVMHFLRDEFDCYDSEGTLFGCIGKADFENLQHVVPPAELISSYEETVSEIDKRIELNECQNVALSSLMQALLPRLMSGELRLCAVEKAVAAAL